MFFGFFVNVRPYQTACTRTAGHRIWKYAGTPMAADWMNWFLGVEGVLDLFDLGDS
ncbi:MAG: hypothetical protein HFI22_08175 [Lachnospiraceae bacterium]|nr:hypothetical protein [Lachnospiraceae bacterium]